MDRSPDLLRFLRTGGMAEVGVAILGDILLDRYLLGSTERVSREAPIPVVVCSHETDNLGGAGNVAMNLKGLDCQVFLAGSVGQDENASRIQRHLKEKGVEAHLFERAASTLTKTRLICGGQQVARFDHEEIFPLDEKNASEAVRWLEKLLDERHVGAVVLSDYGLGFCTPLLCKKTIETAAVRKIPVLVDPRGSDWGKYRGAAVVTPNLSELAAVWGSPVSNEEKMIEEAGESVRRDMSLQWLLVTRSAQGMTLISEKDSIHVPSRPIEVYDVSGAGDTVVACLAASLAAGFPMEGAVRFANDAAQIVVTKAGTVPINAEEFLQEQNVPREAASSQNRIVTWDEAEHLCRKWKDEGLRVVFTNGCFDVLHAGHADSLERARECGDRLIVGLNSDRSVKGLKGEGRPINEGKHRARLLTALRFVDLVVVFDEDTPRELLSRLRPHVLAKGGDYKADELPGREFVEEVVILPLMDGLSTTGTLQRAMRLGG